MGLLSPSHPLLDAEVRSLPFPLEQLWADSDNGSTPALQAGSPGSIPGRSTKTARERL